MNRKYYNRVGQRMIESYQKNFDIPLIVYWEGDDPPSGVQCIDLLKETNLSEFKSRHKNNPRIDDFHLGATKFAPKSYSVIHRLKNSNTDYTIWLDADVFVHSKIDKHFYEQVIDSSKMATVLGREDNYLESGFVVYNHHHQQIKEFTDKYEACYENDKIFEIPQWHDAFVIDWIMRSMKAELHNLTPHGRRYDHVFVDSILGDYMDHMKGPRKDRGSSKFSDMKTRKSNNKYWQGK
jgi:hypothetical protein